MTPQSLARRLAITPLFSGVPVDQLTALIERSPRHHAIAGTTVCEPAQGLRHHLVLLAGELEARRTWVGDDGDEQAYVWRATVGADGPGFAVLGAGSKHMGVRVVGDADWVAIGADELDRLLCWNELGGHPILARHLKVFHGVPLENLAQVLERMAERSAAAGETVITQGEPGDSYFIIDTGEAEVWVTDPLTDVTTLATVLDDGDAFGEEALLIEGNRTATVRMKTPGRLLVLSKTDFDALLKPRMVGVVDAAQARELLAAGGARLIDCRYEMEYAESRIPGAQLVPLQTLRRQGVFDLDPTQTYVVYCRSGRRSSAAAFLLRERGIKAFSLAGGIRDWPFEVDTSTA